MIIGPYRVHIDNFLSMFLRPNFECMQQLGEASGSDRLGRLGRGRPRGQTDWGGRGQTDWGGLGARPIGEASGPDRFRIFLLKEMALELALGLSGENSKSV